jgi:hypothetical protein
LGPPLPDFLNPGPGEDLILEIKNNFPFGNELERKVSTIYMMLRRMTVKGILFNLERLIRPISFQIEKKRDRTVLPSCGWMPNPHWPIDYSLF